MLTIADSHHLWDRRGFLTLGTLGLGGLGLTSLLQAASEKPDLITGKSVIFLFQQGGPSQFETFDPKPEASSSVRTLTGTRSTSLPGVQFGETFEQLAEVAHKLVVVRSFQTENAEHNIQPIVSKATMQANIGSLYSRVAGAINPISGIPTNAVLFPQAACNDVTKGSARGDIAATGAFGAAYAPFVPGAGGNLQRDMRLNLPRDRFEDRQVLRSALDSVRRDWEGQEQSRSVSKFQDQAYELLLNGGAADALDLSKESASVVARYDTRQYAPSHNWARSNRGKRGYYTGQAKSIGKLLLMARRMCEAGCGFVTIHADYEGVWDMHADGENLNMVDGMDAIGRSFDHAVAAFIEDVEARGMSDKILLVCCGEMGRTPRINRYGGRDHWAKLAPLMLYGGGIRGGQVIGQSTRDGSEPETEPLTVPYLISTILHTVFDVSGLRLKPGLGQLARLSEHPVIPGLW
ncbi:MAG: DUF1501 domain-containing protein [Planctomycetota bacterium]